MTKAVLLLCKHGSYGQLDPPSLQYYLVKLHALSFTKSPPPLVCTGYAPPGPRSWALQLMNSFLVELK